MIYASYTISCYYYYWNIQHFYQIIHIIFSSDNWNKKPSCSFYN